MGAPFDHWLATPFGAAIQQHIKNGLKIFPLHGVQDDLSCTCGSKPCGKENKGAGKHPFAETAPHGLLDATDDIQRAAEMFMYRTDLNVGIATGKASNIVVMDIDNKNDGAGAESLKKIQESIGDLPPTMRLITGNGFHLVFDYPEGGLKNSTNSFGEGYPDIDMRGDGGYIVAYPSRHFTGRYYAADPESKSIADLPRMYLDFLRLDRSKKTKKVEDRQQRSGGKSEWSEQQVAEALTFLEPDMPYLEWIFIGMGLHREGFPLDMWDKWSARGLKYHGIADLESHWKGFNANGDRTIGTIIDLAMTQGWKPKSERQDRVAAPEAESVCAPLMKKIAEKKTTKTLPECAKIFPIVEKPKSRFAFEPLGLPGIIGDMTRWITTYAIYDQPELAMLNVLAFCGTVFGRRYASPIDTRTNLYLVGIAKTGAGKDHSRKMINSLAMDAGLSNYIGGNSIRSDTGMLRGLANNSSQLLQLDEFGIFMQALSDKAAPHHVKAISRTLMSLYSDSNSIYHHGDYADAKMSPIRIAAPSLCIYGTTTEDSYVPALKRSALKSGELNRFIVVPSQTIPIPKRNVPAKEVDGNIVEWWKRFSPQQQNSIGGLVNSATMIPRPITVGWGECESRQYDLNLEQVARSNEKTPTQDLWSRLMENTIKIAMIFAIARDPESPEFQPIDFDYAYSIVRASINYMASLMDECIMETPQEQNHNEIMKAIRASGSNGVSRRELLRTFRKLKKRDIDDLISTMIEEDIVTAERSSTAGKPQIIYYSSESEQRKKTIES